MITILFMSADPTDQARLRIQKETREIREKLRLANERDNFRYEERFAVRPQDITQHMLDTNPNIVHFSGHGAGQPGLCFEDEMGRTKLVTAEALQAVFAQFTESVRCVVLNACLSDEQAKAISKHIDFVVGTNDSIADAAAIALAVGFYQALGAGRSVESAFELGKTQILLQGVPGTTIPVIYTRPGAKTDVPLA